MWLLLYFRFVCCLFVWPGVYCVVLFDTLYILKFYGLCLIGGLVIVCGFSYII